MSIFGFTNPFEESMENKENKRNQYLLERAKTNPIVKQQLDANSAEDLKPWVIKYIYNNRPTLQKEYEELDKQGKKNMIKKITNEWRVPPNTTPQTNGSWFGGKRKTKKQRKHRKAGKSKKQRKT